MNAVPSHSPKRRQVTPLMWASGGTLVLHGAFLLALYLWPQQPTKARETLLEVNLSPEKAAITSTSRPTEQPTPFPTEVPRPTPFPPPTPQPKIAKETRIAKAIVPPPKPAIVLPKLKATDSAPKRPRRNPAPSSSSSPKPSQSAPAPRATSPKPTVAKAGGGRSLPAQSDTELPRAPRQAATSAPPRKRDSEAAGTQAGEVDLPRTRSRRGRASSITAPPSSAPVATKDGTEVQIGPSSPSLTSGGSRRAALDLGSGDEERGPLRTGGLKNGAKSSGSGTTPQGRGNEIASGDGAGSGSGGRRGGRRGRKGTRLVGDPFGTNPGSGYGGGTGAGDGSGAGDGAGNGPRMGTRLARRDLGEGGDGDGGLGRSPGTGKGPGLGTGGDGNGGRGTSGRGKGRDGESADGDGGGGTGGTSRGRRGRGGHRNGDTEDQIGRGIWGGFRATFYQDSSQYPDNVDTRTIQGKPIDWRVFTRAVQTKTIPNLDYDWGEKPPAPGMKSTFWSMKAMGRIFVPKDDTYTFYFDELDDAGKLTLDGDTIISVWNIQKSTPASRGKFLKRGPHDIQIEYVQGPATAASIKLSWQSTSFPKEVVGVYKAPDEK